MHIINYLDILHEDLLNKIFDFLLDLYEKDIEKTNNKLLKVKKLVQGLYINVDLYDEVYYINYNNISYCMNNYLYSRYPLENVIIIYRLKLIVNYNPEENTHTPIILYCDLLKKPIYLDILREINKIYEKRTTIFGYYDNHRILENVKRVKKREYKYYNINPSCANNYITFECGY